MRSGVPLHVIRKEVLIEAGVSHDPDHGSFSKASINQKINRVERMMAVEDDWPTQNYEEQVSVPADARWVTLPVGVTLRSIRRISVLFGQTWLPVTQGIGPAERSLYTTDMRATPIARWDYKVDSPGEFEVWPIGAQPQVLLFEGVREIGAMEDEGDVCALDADVIVLRVAAAMLGRDKQEDAALLATEAARLTQQILKDLASTRPRPNVSRTARTIRRPGIDYIPPGSA